jgi:4-hydroxy-2-oxoheptanedioate aldolase
MVALAGYDFVFLDLEHSAMGLPELENHLRAAQGRGSATLVRVPSEEGTLIGRVLDLGADGVVVPRVGSLAIAEAAAAAVRYPPLGERGFYAATRAAHFGVQRERPEHEEGDAQSAEVVLCVQIEERAAVEACEAIAATPGVDLVFVGLADLAMSLGGEAAAGGSINNALRRVSAACEAAGVSLFLPIGGLGSHRVSYEDARSPGATVFLAGSDRRALSEGLAALCSRAVSPGA